VLVAGIATVATMLPAWRASRVNPANALHPE
jgi:ABC-type lipoprotein release transport system permease subunit